TRFRRSSATARAARGAAWCRRVEGAAEAPAMGSLRTGGRWRRRPGAAGAAGPLAALAPRLTLSAAPPAQARLPAELWVTRTGHVTATPGESLTYVVEVWSRTITPGPIEAQLIDILPAGLVACQWTCSPLAGTAACGAASGSGNLVDTSTLTGIVPLTLQA